MKSAAFLTPMAFIVAMMVQDASAHGRLLVPPHRGYIGKLPQFDGLVPVNFGDHSLSAGGIGQTRGGKHGICGDRYSGKRLHETGGEFAKFPQLREKVIGACYAPGSTMDLQVQLTANHMGYFEFGLCKLNSLNDKETEDCFKTLVQPNGEKDWKVPAGNKVFNMQYMLPDGVSCDGDSHCVLRWHYVGWNNPDVGIDGQEQFWNCADIYVSNTCGSSPSPSSSQSTPSTSTPSTSEPTMTYAPKPTAPSSSADTPVTTDTPPSTSGTPQPVDPQPVDPQPVDPQPVDPHCGGGTNCYFAVNNACFLWWSKAQCDSVDVYKWCGAGSSDPSTPSSPKSPPSTNASYPSSSTDTPVTMDTPGTTVTPETTVTPVTTDSPGTTYTPPSTSGGPQPVDPQCGGCTNCYFAFRTNFAEHTIHRIPHFAKELFLRIFPEALPIYNYENLVAIAEKYPEFANTGDSDVDRREVAAFLGQISLESGDLRYVEEINKTMCQQSPSTRDFGKAINLDLVASPELVATDFDLVVGLPGGFAKATHIVNGGLECGVSPPNRDSEKSRIASFKKFCELLGVAPGDNLSCQTADFRPKAL
ncbi:hypothetical protein DYB35_009848 [Aphanomyces astaci]|uniref:Glycoside hydrolase family 19 catalytic domain-containing protein n=1 Tax=Aphanomyces astaci TaxID=112090 RepID=A0A3R6WE37_APHAT|nr:hypothetical protein DYB35_009848 [Aphanomyces astaci]